MSARELLLRYLLQLEEAGETEIFLDTLDAATVYSLLGPGATASPRPSAPASQSPGESASRSPGGILQALAEHAPGVLGEGKGRRAGVGAAPTGSTPQLTPPADSPVTPTSGGRDPDALRILSEEVAGCTACALHLGRQNVVFGEGNPAAEVVVVGEAPGSAEDRTGRPFVGPAGQLLDLLLLTAGFEREEVYICNVIKCRPPGNRDPEPAEVEACSAHLGRQLDAIRPTVLLAVGRFAAQTLLGSTENIGALRGAVHDYRGTPLVVTYHPAFLLRSPQWTRAAWEDLQRLREVLETRRAAH